MKLDLTKINVTEFLSELGMMKIKRDGDEVTFSCPFGLHMRGGAISMRIDSTVCHCFGCGFSGNALTFLEELEDLETNKAINWLSERWNVTRDIDHKNFKNVIQKKLDRLEKKFNTVVTAKDHTIPIISDQELEDREIDWDYVEEYPGNTNMHYMLLRGFAPQTLIDWNIGWDALSNRFTIPYHDKDGNLMGFKGRGLADRVLKYKVLGGEGYNFETMTVSSALFGLHKVEYPNKYELIICEGELNCISMHQDGWKNTVGISGRQLSDRQLDLIKQNCSHAVIIFDDWKDQVAAAKQLRDFISVSVVPEHEKDPADMTREEKSSLLLNAKSGILL